MLDKLTRWLGIAALVVAALAVYNEMFNPPMTAYCAFLMDRADAGEPLPPATLETLEECRFTQKRYGQKRWHPNPDALM